MRPSPRTAFVAVVLALSIAAVALVARGGATGLTLTGPTPIRPHPDLAPFQGLGVWVDLYDAGAWRDPAAAVETMAAHGVRTLYLETSNDSRAKAFVAPAKVADFLDAAAAHGIRVVAWYFAGFTDPTLDIARAEAAIRLRTPAGHGFSGFALDIESPAVADVAIRSQRLLQVSAALRAAAGPTYPLGAIVPSPLGLRAHHGYWPSFPWAQIAQIYDTILPMSYFTWGPPGQTGAYESIVTGARLIRAWVGNDLVPIHEIGGLAQHATAAETLGFVQAVRDSGAVGASFYSWTGMKEDQWRALAGVRPIPVGIPALPVRPGLQALGNVPGGDQTHPAAVAYDVIGQAGPRTLRFQLLGAGVSVSVDRRTVANEPAGSETAWRSLSLTIPDALLNDASRNVVTFVPTTDGAVWGVRGVHLGRA